MKTLATAILIFGVTSAVAQIPVTDAGMIAQQQQTILGQAESIAKQVIELHRMGDPALVRNIQGAIQVVESLRRPGVGKTLDEIAKAASGAGAFTYSGDGLYRIIRDRVRTADGQEFPRQPQDYKKYEALNLATVNYRAVHDDTETRRKDLRQQLQTTTEQLRVATCQAEVEKLQGVLAAQSAALGALDQEREAAASRVVVIAEENKADREKQHLAEIEEHVADFQTTTVKLAEFLAPDTGTVTIPSSKPLR